MANKYSDYPRSTRSKHDLVFETYKDAEEIFHRFAHIIDDYTEASIADLNDLMGFPTTYSDNRFGWTSYANVTINRCREGYLLSFPDPKVLPTMSEVTKMLSNAIYGYSAPDNMLHSAKSFIFTAEIINVVYNDPATIVFWSDNTKTIVKATNEKFDPEKGLAMAIAKKYYGNQGNYFNHLKKWIPSHKPVAFKAKHKVGDQISFDLKGFGHYTATAHKINDDGSVIFLFDTILPEERRMNNEKTNAGGFGKSDLKKWMEEELLPAFPDDIRGQIRELTIPTVGQIFGKDEWCEDAFVSDQDEQWPLMKAAEGRKAKRNGDYDWYWLQNATKKDVSAASFAAVYSGGAAYFTSASVSFGVRPCLVIEPPCGDKEETRNA